jgi:hypothetical protein
VHSRTWATPDASGGGGGGGGVQGVQPAHGQSSPVVTNTSSNGGRGAISTSKAPSKLASPDRNALNKASSLLLSPDRNALNKASSLILSPDRNALNKPPPGFAEAAGGASTTHLGGPGGSAVARLIASRKSARCICTSLLALLVQTPLTPEGLRAWFLAAKPLASASSLSSTRPLASMPRRPTLTCA